MNSAEASEAMQHSNWIADILAYLDHGGFISIAGSPARARSMERVESRWSRQEHSLAYVHTHRYTRLDIK